MGCTLVQPAPAKAIYAKVYTSNGVVRKPQRHVYREKVQQTPQPISSTKEEFKELHETATVSTYDNSDSTGAKEEFKHEDVTVSAFSLSDFDDSSDQAEHQDAKSDATSRPGSEHVKDNKSHASSRRGSISMTTASEDEEHPASRGMTDQEHSDIDVCSVELLDSRTNIASEEKFSSP